MRRASSARRIGILRWPASARRVSDYNPIETTYEKLDPLLISGGCMFGLLFFGLGAATAFSAGSDVRLLALGTALLALSRAAEAAAYARRHRCRCNEADPEDSSE